MKINNIFSSFCLAFLFSLLPEQSYAQDVKFELLPAPRFMELFEGYFQPAQGSMIWAPEIAREDVRKSSEKLIELMRSRDLPMKVTNIWVPGECAVTLKIRPELMDKPDGYRIRISPDQIIISAYDAAGLHYAITTLGQIFDQIPKDEGLPCMKIIDWPDFAHRGIMIDVSRDKVPKMETFYQMVDMFASWKINQLQLYTEHAFAYKNHEKVWEDATPMTAEQVQVLDKYCRERYIELVPNQNSFGHMKRWLKHDPYRQYAEAPDGFYANGNFNEPSALCATDPRSIALVNELLDELIPNFSSDQVNVGCDETYDLGKVRTKEICEEKGTGRVYLDFLLKIYDNVEKHGNVMQFWGDIIKGYPELIPELPENIIAMVWGYRPEHPYDKECPKFQQSGVPFYVCPGTSSWLSLSGRTIRAITNITNAAENGKKFGATGILVTDWGDRGHWQKYPVAFPAFVYGAGLSWSVDDNKEADIPALMDRYVFKDEANVMGKLVYDLGNSFAAAEGYYDGNTSYLARTLIQPDVPMSSSTFNWLTKEKIEEVRTHVEKSMKPLSNAHLKSQDAALIIPEVEHSAKLVLFACDLLEARLAAKDGEVVNIPKKERKQLAARLKDLVKEHETIWLKRNRTGGLSDSSANMDALMKMLES